MTKELYIETIKKGCAFLEEEGYQFNQIETSIFYTKNFEQEGYRISFSWTEYGDNFHTYGLSAKKRFNIVERELQKVLGGELTNYYTIHKSPSQNYMPKNIEQITTENNIRFVLKSSNEINRFGEFIKDFYMNEVLVFFKNYETFDRAAKAYSALVREKISTFVLNTGSDIFYRELVIKNKANANDEIDFFKMVLEELEPMKNNPTFEKILNNFKHIQKNLHS